jgi:dienelactone hydrolase
MIEVIEIDGATAWLARPDEPTGAVVLCHGGGGLAAHERGVVERLAARGFAVVAPDLLRDPNTVRARELRDRGEPVPDELRALAAATVRGLVAAPATLRQRVASAVERMRVFGRVAVIGHCFGGTAALEAARGQLPIECAASLHGGLSTAAPSEQIDARVLACCGAADPYCPVEQRAAFEAEMTRAGARWDLHVYGGVLHGFSVQGSDRTPGCRYDERADRTSWAAVTALLDETIRA